MTRAEDGLPPDIHAMADRLSHDLRPLLVSLLLYKEVFTSRWTEHICRAQDAQTQRVLETIMRETVEQGRDISTLMLRWDSLSDSADAGRTRDMVLTRLLEDLLHLKDRSVEVFLATGLRAPTNDLRRGFIKYADVDRRHAESLREVLRQRYAMRVHGDAPGEGPPPEPRRSGVRGVHVGPFPQGTLSELIRNAVDEARAAGHPPTRIVMSDLALRHVRDEGGLDVESGQVCGLPTDIDLAWGEEAFALLTGDVVGLAEIVAQMRAREEVPRG